MKWIEIIELRLSRRNKENKMQFLEDLIDDFRNELGTKSIKIYTHVSLDTDYIIQIKHNRDRISQTGSRLGIQLVAALREIGLVNHNVWQEKKLRNYEELQNVTE